MSVIRSVFCVELWQNSHRVGYEDWSVRPGLWGTRIRHQQCPVLPKRRRHSNWIGRCHRERPLIQFCNVTWMDIVITVTAWSSPKSILLNISLRLDLASLFTAISVYFSFLCVNLRYQCFTPVSMLGIYYWWRELVITTLWLCCNGCLFYCFERWGY